MRCIIAGMLQIASHAEVLARFGHALSDPTRTRILLALREAPAYPADLAEILGVSRTNLSNHLACLRGCGLVIAAPEGRRTRYELAEPSIAHALGDLLGLVLAIDPTACPTDHTTDPTTDHPTAETSAVTTSGDEECG